jgi:lipoprotein-releasing system ATP-binding protein
LLTDPTVRAAAMPDLVLANATRDYPTRGEPLRILTGVNLSLDEGENASIIGPSGSGKSTLLYILGALDQPTNGSYELFSRNPASLNEEQLAEFRLVNIGFVFQEHYLLPQCSALENVLLPAVARGGADAAVIDRGKFLLDKVGLAARANHRPSELSGGERQRVAIARALLLKPRLLLADEPTGNLDRSSATAIGDLLIELQKAEQTILVAVTHSTELAARFQHRFELDAGKLVAR